MTDEQKSSSRESNTELTKYPKDPAMKDKKNMMLGTKR